MLKLFMRATGLLAFASLSLIEMAPATANGNTCANDCTRTRPCEYRGRELTLVPPPPLVPTAEPPAPLIDPPPVETPVTPPEPVRPLPPKPGINRRGRG